MAGVVTDQEGVRGRMADGFCFCFVEFIRNCEQGATALIVAAQHDRGEVVELLLERGAQIDRADNDVRCSCCFTPPCGGRRGKEAW